MSRAAVRGWALTAAVFALTGLAASRVTLVGHELVGHGAVAVAQGCDLVAYRLFLFGGGWVSYDCEGARSAGEALVVALGGVAVELVVAAAALLVAWRLARGSVARVALVGIGMVDLLHAGYYIAVGTHHGFGDGRVVQDLLGDRRVFLVVPLAVLLVPAGALLARRLAREVSAWVPGGAAARAGAVVAAALAAAAFHGALAFGERALRDDDVYARIMRHESEREVARDLDAYRRAAAARGRAPTAEQIAAARAEFEARHRRFPLRVVLAIALGLACLAGLWWGMRAPWKGEGAPPPDGWRALVPLGVVTLGAVVAVYLIDLRGGG